MQTVANFSLNRFKIWLPTFLLGPRMVETNVIRVRVGLCERDPRMYNTHLVGPWSGELQLLRSCNYCGALLRSCNYCGA